MTFTGGLTGYFFGSALGDLTLGYQMVSGWVSAPNATTAYLGLNALFCKATGVFFMSRKLLKVERSYAELARLQATESQLKLLQNQLDPHMLLNALSNMRVLIA
jgi:hypothetical protein